MKDKTKKTEESPPEVVHTKDAIKAITEEEVEISTPPLVPDHIEYSSYDLSPVNIPSVTVYDKDQNVHPLRGGIHRQDETMIPLYEQETVVEEEEQPKTLSNNKMVSPQPNRLSPVLYRRFNRHLSTGAHVGPSSRYNKVKSVAFEPSTPGIVEFRRALSVQPGAGEERRAGTLFGGNSIDVERILNRMAVAIKKDLDL